MTIDYISLASVATQLLTDDGQSVTISRTSPGTYDPVTGTTTGATTTTYDTVGVYTKISFAYAQTNEVQQGDRMMLIDGSVKPENGDSVTADSVTMSVVNVQPINPAGTPLAYRVQLR